MSASTLISPVLPLIEDEFLVGHARATALVSLISLGSAAATFVFGLFAGFAGYKRSILVAFSVSTVLFLLIPRAGGFSHLALLFLMIGVANGVYYPRGCFEWTSEAPPGVSRRPAAAASA